MKEHNQELNTRKIAIADLIPSKSNARRYASETGIDELAASIKAKGLLQNLNVRKNDRGKYEVTAGARRLRA